MNTLTRFSSVAAALLAVGGALSPQVAVAQGKLNVVATTPDLGALARAIGGDVVDVKVLAKPTEDPHFVDPKPSLIVTLNHADVLIDGGAELEIGWLPALLETARNTKIANGAPGRVSAAVGVRMLEVPATLDRAKGDVHALGNPHFLIDPLNVKLIVVQIADHLSEVRPASAAAFKANLAAFQSQIDAKIPEWTKQLAPYKGAKIVTYHNDFVYLAQRFGLIIVTTLEPKPGIPPSPGQLAQVVTKMKAENAKVILVQPYQNRKTAENVARQTGGMVLDLSQQPGALPGTDSYFALMDSMVRTLAAALAKP